VSPHETCMTVLQQEHRSLTRPGKRPRFLAVFPSPKSCAVPCSLSRRMPTAHPHFSPGSGCGARSARRALTLTRGSTDGVTPTHRRGLTITRLRGRETLCVRSVLPFLPTPPEALDTAAPCASCASRAPFGLASLSDGADASPPSNRSVAYPSHHLRRLLIRKLCLV